MCEGVKYAVSNTKKSAIHLFKVTSFSFSLILPLSAGWLSETWTCWEGFVLLQEMCEMTDSFSSFLFSLSFSFHSNNQTTGVLRSVLNVSRYVNFLCYSSCIWMYDNHFNNNAFILPIQCIISGMALYCTYVNAYVWLVMRLCTYAWVVECL